MSYENDPDVETWASVAEFPNYQVSTFGRVRNITTGHVLTPCKLRVSGHNYITFILNGKKVVRYVHRLVLLAFVGPPKRTQECDIIDGNPDNCRLENLQWERRTDKYKGHNSGGKSPMASLTDAQATAIRYRALAGETGRALSREYKICESTVSQIKNRKLYIEDYCTSCGKRCFGTYICDQCNKESRC